MAPASETLLRLELETHAYHREVDQAWLDLMTPFLSRVAYAEQLARTYCFEAPLEAALAYTPHVASLDRDAPALGTRSRARLLRHDLFALDYPLTRVAPRLIAPFPSVCEALGWLYVVERSAQLFDMIRRNVLARIPDAPAEYLTDGGAGARWEHLGRVLDRVAGTSGLRDQIVHAAHDGFRCLLDLDLGEQPLRRRA